ncbi:MAG: methyl-accepting chemotaxis protein, partial [Alphaproteobacteria bacterium]|nr:methyl-accepting chemotaxis protein [Alphaproteobacteria bacterium]
KQIADLNTFLSINRNVSAQAAISSANLILLEKAFEEFQKTSENLIKSIDSPEHKKIIEELSQKYVKEKRILFQAISDSIAKGEKYSGKINYEPTLVQSIDYTSAVAQLLDENLKRIMRRTWIRLGYELLVTIFAVAIGLVLVRLLLSSVAQPLTKSTHVMEELSEGIVPDVLPELNQADFNRKDEIGKLTKALKSFHEVLLERKSLLDARELEKAIANRAKRVEMLNREFENESRNSLAILAESSNQLNVTAKSMVGSANNTNENAASVATATQQVGDFIEVVSTSSHELVRSLDQIGTQVETSQDTIRAAVSEAKESITQINNLNNAADKIGDIVGLINSIASQTNLLALNATIEAARAGDAGRGFAVVANEVKSLAAQTANATEEISAQIGAMQAATTDTVQTIERIASTINRIDALAGTIRESLQRERAMTENMANLVKQAENGADQVTSNLSQFTKAADTTSSAAEQVLGASEAMRDQARLLNARIDTYLQAVATA